MKRPLLRFLLAGSLAFGVFAAHADESELFDGRYYAVPMGSLAMSRASRSDENAYGGGLAIGKSLMPHLGIEILGDYLHYRGKTVTTPTTGPLCGLLTPCPDQVTRLPDQSVWVGGIGVNYYLSPDNEGVFVHANVEGGDRFIYNAGLGFDQALFKRSAYLRLEALYHKEASYDAEPLFHVGFRIPFGATREPEQAEPSPVAVVPVEQPVADAEAAPPADGEAVSTPAESAPPASDATPATADAAVAAAPAPAPTPAKKHVAKRRKKAAAVARAEAPAAPEPTPALPAPAAAPAPSPAPGAGSPGGALAPTEPAPAPPEPAAVQAIQDAGTVAADRSVPTAPASSTTPPDDTLAPTEPAPAPPEAAMPQADLEASPASSMRAVADRSAPSAPAPSTTPPDETLAPTEPAPAPPGNASP